LMGLLHDSFREDQAVPSPLLRGKVRMGVTTPSSILPFSKGEKVRRKSVVH
jgi:hypothetical protein